MRLSLRPFDVSRAITIALLCAVMTGASSVQAATLTVTTTADNGTGSLRATIAAASDGDTIQFDSTLNGQTISLTGGELVIDKNIIISGPGPNLLTVSRVSTASRFSIFHIMPGHTVAISGLNISGGHGNAIAGGIWNEGNSNLTISNCIVSNNVSEGYGGGILSEGTLMVVDSIVASNRARYETGNPFG